MKWTPEVIYHRLQTKNTSGFVFVLTLSITTFGLVVCPHTFFLCSLQEEQACAMNLVVNIEDDMEAENIDLIEPDSDDSDFEVQRAKNVPSRTLEVASRIRKFLGILPDNSPTGRKHKKALTFHISICCRNKCPNERVKAFITLACTYK